MPPEAGLITGIIGGLVVGLLSGSPLQVSGPAAGLVVLVFELYQQHGMAALGVMLMMAGLLQIGQDYEERDSGFARSRQQLCTAC